MTQIDAALLLATEDGGTTPFVAVDDLENEATEKSIPTVDTGARTRLEDIKNAMGSVATGANVQEVVNALSPKATTASVTSLEQALLTALAPLATDAAIAAVGTLLEQIRDTVGTDATLQTILAELGTRASEITLAGLAARAELLASESTSVNVAARLRQMSDQQPMTTAFGQALQGSLITQAKARWDKSLAQNLWTDSATGTGAVTVDQNLSKLVLSTSGAGTATAISDLALNYRPLWPLFIAFTFRIPTMPTAPGEEIVLGGGRLGDDDEIAVVARAGKLWFRITREGGTDPTKVLFDVPMDEWNRDRCDGQTPSRYGVWDWASQDIVPRAIDTTKEQLAIILWAHLGAVSPTLILVPPALQRPIVCHVAEHINFNEVTNLRRPNVQIVHKITSVGSALTAESGSSVAGVIGDPFGMTADEIDGNVSVDAEASQPGAATPTTFVVHTVTPGRRLRVTALELGAFSSVTTGQLLTVTDGPGGPVRGYLTVAPGTPVSTAPSEKATTYGTVPKTFDVSVFVNVPAIGSGTQVYVSALGYEEDAP